MFLRQELKFEAQIKARRMRELEEETQRMQELMESEKARMQEEMRTAQRLAKVCALHRELCQTSLVTCVGGSEVRLRA